jgi:hypothetical protein
MSSRGRYQDDDDQDYNPRGGRGGSTSPNPRGGRNAPDSDEDYGRGRRDSRSPSPGSQQPPQRRGQPQQQQQQQQQQQPPPGQKRNPFQSQFDDGSDDELTPEEQKEYEELLSHFGGDENALAEAIEAFMEEFERNGGQIPDDPTEPIGNGMGNGRGQSRSPSPGRR